MLVIIGICLRRGVVGRLRIRRIRVVRRCHSRWLHNRLLHGGLLIIWRLIIWLLLSRIIGLPRIVPIATATAPTATWPRIAVLPVICTSSIGVIVGFCFSGAGGNGQSLRRSRQLGRLWHRLSLVIEVKILQWLPWWIVGPSRQVWRVSHLLPWFLRRTPFWPA